jgi:hypothetical protein
MVKGGGLIAMLNCLAAVKPEVSATWTVNVDVPAADGVPDMVAPLSERPAGRAPAVIDQVYGPDPPLAASVCE